MTDLTLLAALVLSAQNLPPVDQAKVDAAIDKGVAYLRRAGSPGHDSNVNGDELLLLTCIHAGVGPQDPYFKALLKRATRPLVASEDPRKKKEEKP